MVIFSKLGLNKYKNEISGGEIPELKGKLDLILLPSNV